MSDYLSNLTAKSLDQVAVLQPRLASRFEPLSIAKQGFSEIPSESVPEPEQQSAIADPFLQPELDNYSERRNVDHSFVKNDTTDAVLEALMPESPQQRGILSQHTKVERSELEGDSALTTSAGKSGAIEPEIAAARDQNTRAIVPKTQAERQIAADVKESGLEEVTKEALPDLFPPPQHKLVRSMEQTPPIVPDQPVTSPIVVEVTPAKSGSQNSARMTQPAPDRSPEIAQLIEGTTNALPGTVVPPAPRESEQAWRRHLSHPVVEPHSTVASAVQSFDLAPAPILIPRLVQPAVPQSGALMRSAAEPAQPSEFAVTEPPPTPTIQVTIGRIEVRATPPPSTPSQQRSTPAVMGLDDYLRQRAKGANR